MFASLVGFLFSWMGSVGIKGCSNGYVKRLKGLLEFTRFLSRSLCLKGSTLISDAITGLKGGLSDFVCSPLE